jgi:hypothetical protein
MPNLSVEVKNKIAKAENKQIVCGNSDYTIEFLFDDEWANEPVKIARFVWNKQFVDVQFTGDTCDVPLVYKTNTLAVGVYAGDLKTTTPAIFACHQSILCEDAVEPSIDPREYEEIMRLLNAQANEIELVKIENANILNELTEIRETTENIDERFTELENKIDATNDTLAAVEEKADEALARNVFTDEEKNKLSTLENYDDTEVKAAIEELETNKADKADLSTLENSVDNLKIDKLDKTTKYALSDNPGGAALEAISDETGANIAEQFAELENKTDATNDAVTSVSNDLQTAFSNINEVEGKADEALARNVFTDEEKAKLAGITNPMVIKGRVDTVADLPTEAEIGWFYFVGLESASSYKEYCYSETGWEYIGLSEEGVDLSNYYTKAQVDSKNQTLEGYIQTNTNMINLNSTNIENLQTDVDNLQKEIDTNTADIAALKAVDTSIMNSLETIDQTATDALTATKTNKNDIAINRTTLGYQRKNQLNETGYLSSITSVYHGTSNISGNQISFTATGSDCYTKPYASDDGGYRIPVDPDTDYILSWESDNSNNGFVYVFMNGSTINHKTATNSGSKRLKFTTNSDTTFITIRLGVATSGDSITYSNIMLRYADINDDTYEAYQPSLQEQTPYSLSVSGNSTSAAISYSGVPTLICLTPNTADSTAGGLYMINSAGAVIKLIEKTGVVVAADTASNTFTITNNTSTVMDVCISRCWGR